MDELISHKQNIDRGRKSKLNCVCVCVRAGGLSAALHRYGHLHVFSHGVHCGARRVQHQLHLHAERVVVGRCESTERTNTYTPTRKQSLYTLCPPPALLHTVWQSLWCSCTRQRLAVFMRRSCTFWWQRAKTFGTETLYCPWAREFFQPVRSDVSSIGHTLVTCVFPGGLKSESTERASQGQINSRYPSRQFRISVQHENN